MEPAGFSIVRKGVPGPHFVDYALRPIRNLAGGMPTLRDQSQLAVISDVARSIRDRKRRSNFAFDARSRTPVREVLALNHGSLPCTPVLGVDV